MDPFIEYEGLTAIGIEIVFSIVGLIVLFGFILTQMMTKGYNRVLFFKQNRRKIVYLFISMNIIIDLVYFKVFSDYFILLDVTIGSSMVVCLFFLGLVILYTKVKLTKTEYKYH